MKQKFLKDDGSIGMGRSLRGEGASSAADPAVEQPVAAVQKSDLLF